MTRSATIQTLSLLAAFFLILAGTTYAKRDVQPLTWNVFYHYGWPYPWLHLRVEHTDTRAFYEMREPVPHRRITHLERIDWRALGAAATISAVFATLLWLPFFAWRRKKETRQSEKPAA
jgi:hypothetical protein